MIDPRKLLDNPTQVNTRDELIGIWMIVMLSHYRDQEGSTEDLIRVLSERSQTLTNESMYNVIRTAAPRLAELCSFNDGLLTELMHTLSPPFTPETVVEPSSEVNGTA